MMTADGRWLERPSLAYHWAFDACAALAYRAGEPTAVYASSSFYARELVRRLEGEVLLRFPGGSALSEAELRAALGPEIDWDRLRLEPEGAIATDVPPRAILWAEPETPDWQATLSEIVTLAGAATELCVLGAAGLRRILPEWRQGTVPPARVPLGASAPLVRALHRLGWAVEHQYGFQGPVALLLGALSRLPAALGREDQVDRCFAAARQAYVVRGWQARWAPVWAISAVRDSSHGRETA